MAKRTIAAETAEEAPVKSSKSEVVVEFEGKTRTYTGPDAKANAESFVSKSPMTRKILKKGKSEESEDESAE